MFAIGSAEPPRPEVVGVLRTLAQVLGQRPEPLVIRGHTDGRPFRSEEYDNWRLSTARAHMAYHMLVHGGFDEGRIARVEGHADRIAQGSRRPRCGGKPAHRDPAAGAPGMTARIAPCLRDLLRLILLAGAGLATLLLAPAPAVGESEARIAAREQAARGRACTGTP